MSDPQLPSVGDRAPEFSAESPEGSMVSLAGLLERGPAVLIFYPGNNTPG